MLKKFAQSLAVLLGIVTVLAVEGAVPVWIALFILAALFTVLFIWDRRTWRRLKRPPA